MGDLLFGYFGVGVRICCGFVFELVVVGYELEFVDVVLFECGLMLVDFVHVLLFLVILVDHWCVLFDALMSFELGLVDFCYGDIVNVCERALQQCVGDAVGWFNAGCLWREVGWIAFCIVLCTCLFDFVFVIVCFVVVLTQCAVEECDMLMLDYTYL